MGTSTGKTMNYFFLFNRAPSSTRFSQLLLKDQRRSVRGSCRKWRSVRSECAHLRKKGGHICSSLFLSYAWRKTRTTRLCQSTLFPSLRVIHARYQDQNNPRPWENYLLPFQKRINISFCHLSLQIGHPTVKCDPFSFMTRNLSNEPFWNDLLQL